MRPWIFSKHIFRTNFIKIGRCTRYSGGLKIRMTPIRRSGIHEFHLTFAKVALKKRRFVTVVRSNKTMFLEALLFLLTLLLHKAA